MATNYTDKLSKIINNGDTSERIESFVWISLCCKYENGTNFQTTSNNFRDNLADLLIRDDYIKSWIVRNLNYGLIPDHHMRWIVDSHRQTKWIEQYIKIYSSTHLNTRPYNSKFNLLLLFNRIPAHLLGRIRSVAIFDYWAANVFSTVDEIIQHCHDIEVDWNRFTEDDRLFSWLDDGDAEEKREFFHKWLKLGSYSCIGKILNLPSHDDVLSCIDQGIYSKAEKTLLRPGALRARMSRRCHARRRRKCCRCRCRSSCRACRSTARGHRRSAPRPSCRRPRREDSALALSSRHGSFFALREPPHCA